LLRKELRQRVQAALALLSAEDREIVVLRHLERLKLREIAVMLGISEAAAQSRYRRAVERLQHLLSETSGEES
jgi:RNA polymerase sigma-70 factor (ECF subfamily)